MADGGRFVLAHGFTQTARSWETFARLLRDAWPGADVVAADLPGHGTCPHLRTDLWGSADHLVATGGTGTYVGYSMGGRVSLHAAIARPDEVERLVLIGTTAGLDDDAERARRRADDDRLADHVERVGVDAFVDEWLRNPLFAGLTDDTAMRADRRTNTAAGLASSLRLAGTGTQEPLWDRLPSIGIPALVAVGEHDDKFRRLGARLVDGLPRGELAVVEGAGHSAHLEQPSRTVDAITAWLDRHP